MGDFVDPYLDLGTGILKNFVGAKTEKELKTIEADMVVANELEIGEQPNVRKHDVVGLVAIHKFLFGNIYPFAGEFRTVDIRKNVEGSEYFLICGKIPMALQYVFSELAKEKYLKGLSRDSFVERLTYFYDQLNFVHPFREGNGRAQRIFWNFVADEAGYFIDWNKVVGAENDLASKMAAEKMDTTLLRKMFNKIVEKKNG